eukprot:CAMPEP_0175817996 /NCGR_PEP_ID=MMETSP0107_2-20121207/7310_1 /TAXON_ID=195067 ORGANISM="Goniomonas pacifica, Strain CCMP1869" /NCGR_SAMPLE_ID=MMETSP0107_2 /ASSEMBLY_ACC=CAM_ASM_000203 /LENGTH=400 /DNA_ID=CAMNT_0017130167 /DNA_START=1 /DNA_END=1203 /DNA_ORIENTATION=-
MYVAKKVSRAQKRQEITKLSDDLYIGPQPTEAELSDLAAKGVKAVLNLRDPSEAGSEGMYVLPAEKNIVEKLGMTYLNIPTTTECAPSAECKAKVQEALATLPKPALLHCKRMNRSRLVCGQDIMQPPEVFCFFDSATFTAQYVVVDVLTQSCAVIDSVDKITDFIKENGLDLRFILETHVHADHITGAHVLKERFPTAKTAIGVFVKPVQETFAGIFNFTEFKADGSQFDLLFADGDKFKLGYTECTVLHTPGHTPACVCYHMGDAVFVGDTIFMPDMGTARCDFPGGSAETLYASCQKLFALPETTRVFVGHDYGPGGREFQWETTVAEELARNKSLNKTTSEGEFVEWRKGRDATLAVPRLILPSLQVNLSAGRLPPAEDNGTSYLKIPLNVLGKPE